MYIKNFVTNIIDIYQNICIILKKINLDWIFKIEVGYSFVYCVFLFISKVEKWVYNLDYLVIID